MSVADMVHASGVAFGTSGARGLVTAMTDEVCHGYTTGFLRHLLSQGSWKPDSKVALAGDLRPSTPGLIAACSLAVTDLGGNPEFCGFVPTPALAYHAMREGIPAIMVTGSHIPDDRNGIKFYRPDGEILKDDEALILRQQVGARAWGASGMMADPATLGPQQEIAAAYISRYIDVFGSDHLRGMRVGVYQHSAVGRDILSEVLTALGAQVVELGRSDRFVPVDTEAVRPEDIALARSWATDQHFDAIVSTDGDSDRPLVADETGEWLRGDVLAMLCARALGMRTVITPVSSNTVVERSGFFRRVERTKIGSPYVIKAMQLALAAGEDLVCGYEANGGFLLGSDLQYERNCLAALPTRDAVLPIIAVLGAARGGSLSGLMSALPGRVTYSARIADFSPARRDRLLGWMLDNNDRDTSLSDAFAPVAGRELVGLDLTDGVRMEFGNDRVIHIRGSGNAPELRCYAEAESQIVAERLANEALRVVSERF